MTDRMLDPSLRRAANEAWYVSGRASQRHRYRICIDMLMSRLPTLGMVYDIGAATGQFARLLAGVAREAVGIEKMPDRVAACRANHSDVSNLCFLQGDILTLDLPAGEADAACALEMIYYVDPAERGNLFDIIARLLRPDGFLLVSLNAFASEGGMSEQELLSAIGKRFHIVDVRAMHRMYYYRLELPVIRLLDAINYLEHIKVFYPHVLSIEHTVYSPWLDRLLLPPSIVLDRVVLPAIRWTALALLDSNVLYRLITGMSRWLRPSASRSQIIILAKRSN